MTKNHQHHTSGSVARQYFFVPQRASFLELRTTLDSTLPYAEHVHSAFSLGLILQGKTLFTLGGSKYLAEEGDIALIAPGCAHSCNPVDGPRGYYMLFIDAAWLWERMGEGLLACPALIKDAALSFQAGAVMDAILADQENAADMLAELLLELQARHSLADDKGGETHPYQWPALTYRGDTHPYERRNSVRCCIGAGSGHATRKFFPCYPPHNRPAAPPPFTMSATGKSPQFVAARRKHS